MLSWLDCLGGSSYGIKNMMLNGMILESDFKLAGHDEHKIRLLYTYEVLLRIIIGNFVAVNSRAEVFVFPDPRFFISGRKVASVASIVRSIFSCRQGSGPIKCRLVVIVAGFSSISHLLQPDHTRDM